MKALGKGSVVSIVDFDWIRTSVFLLVGTDYVAIRHKSLALLKKRGAPIPIARQRQIFADVEASARAAFSGDIAHAVEELYDCIAVCLRTVDVLEGRQKLGKPETKGETT